MKKDDLKKQLLSGVDIIVDIVFKGNTAEVKKNKDGILILETIRKKMKENEQDVKTMQNQDKKTLD